MVMAAKRKNMDRKQGTREAPPLTVAMVKALELIVLNEEVDLGMRSVIGFILFVLYTRERVTDAARVKKEPWCVGPPHVLGHIESRTVSEDTKHGQSEQRRRRPVVLLGNAWGVTTKGSWGHAWLQVRRRMGQDAKKDKTLQNRVDKNWNPVKGTMINASQVTTILRRVLKNYSRRIDQHSSQGLKATPLSWTGKRGVLPDVQKILGSHANGKAEMKNLYARDSLCWPVNVLGMVIQEIKAGYMTSHGYQPDNRQRHLQLSPAVYAQALSGGFTGGRQVLEDMRLLEEISTDPNTGESKSGGDPTYMDATRVAEVVAAVLPTIKDIQTIPAHATHEDDERLVQPILEAQPPEPVDVASDSESDGVLEAKEPTTSESLTNIAADLTVPICEEPPEDMFILDLTDDSVHLQHSGNALCWVEITGTDLRQKRKRCIYVEDPGTSEICGLCSKYGTKRRRVDPAPF